jgi:hypothetical protein
LVIDTFVLPELIPYPNIAFWVPAADVVMVFESAIGPTPYEFVAHTWNVYDVLAVKPVIEIGDVADEKTVPPVVATAE